MEVNIEPSWKEALHSEFQQPYFEHLVHFVKQAYASGKIYPPASLIFNAFNLCSTHRVKVVILGQDPYHGTGQAHGLCFSVRDGVPLPPSLLNIFKEIQRDLGIELPESGNLTRWAVQGVLLLNATLTVEAHRAGSHQGRGWESFTDAVIRWLSDHCNGLVFMLWGSYAQQKSLLIDSTRHLILQAPHPSPLSAYRGFLGCNHFSKCNNYLMSQQKEPIQW